MADRLSADQARLLPRYREQALLERQQAAVFRREHERGTSDGVDTASPGWKVPVGDDRERLRGLPAVAPGVHSAMKGTDPLREAIRRDEQRRR